MFSSSITEPHPSSAQPPKLLDQVRHTLRVKHSALRTEAAYTHWMKRFILFHDKRHPSEMNTPDIGAFLTHLAVHGQVTASTQNPPRRARLFSYNEVLHPPFDPRLHGVYAKRPERCPRC